MRQVTGFLSRHLAGSLAQRLALHQRLLQAVRRPLPSYLRAHCQVCWVNSRGQLMLQVDGQEYAAQVRFFVATMLDAARSVAGEDVKQVLIRTAIPEAQSKGSMAVARPAVTRLLAEEADASTVPEIGMALSRLAIAMASRCEEQQKKNPPARGGG